ncbi:MAG: hypothetical protein KF775_16050 [Cyclobacteriaceae bacterium]|nr:hypothetical protein [Cyclobacteriaceae bacterium]
MMTKEIKTDLFADYFQFYIQDEQTDGDLSNSWTQEAVDRFLALAPGTIGIGTVRNMDVPVTVKLFDREPEIDNGLESVEQINECDIETTSDKLVLAGCTEYFPDALRIEVNKGIYRARIYYGNLDKLSENGLEGDDYYEIHLWPTNKLTDLKVIKSKNASA